MQSFHCADVLAPVVPARLLHPSTVIAAKATAGRRQLVAELSIVLLGVAPADANAAANPRESIADFASGIPGYGPSDVFYPSWFLGDWDARSELVAVETPQGEAAAGEAAVKARVRIGTAAALELYPQRYFSYRGRIIADRGYNVRSLVRSGGTRSFESVDWDASNPNSLKLVFKRDGTSISTDILVTKRAIGEPEGRPDLFNSSEFYQEVVSGATSGLSSDSLDPVGLAPASMIPKVTPIRCVNKFRLVDGPQIQVIQRVEVFASPFSSDSIALDFGQVQQLANMTGGRPVVIYRYRAILTPSKET